MRTLRRSIRSKFTFVFLLGAGAVLLVYALDQMGDVRRAETACVSSNRAVAKIAAHTLARRVESLCVSHRQWAQRLAGGPETIQALKRGCQNLDRELGANLSSSSFIPISTVSAAVSPGRVGRSIISDLRPSGGKPVFSLTTPFRFRSGRGQELVTVVRAEALSDCIPEPDNMDPWCICGLISRSGAVVASGKTRALRFCRQVDLSRVARGNWSGGRYTLSCSAGGEEAIGVVEIVPGAGWQVAVLQRAETALGPARRAWEWILVSVMAVLAVLASAVVMSNRLVHSIRRLALGASALAVGDYRKRIRIDTGDELEYLGESFNALGESLAEHEARLREQAEMLAGMVEAARVASSSLDLRECGKAIANVVCTHLGASDAALFRKDRVNGGVEMIGQHGKCNRAAWKRLAAHSAESGEYLVITQSESDPEDPERRIEALLVGAPLKSGNETLGAIVARFGSDLSRDDLRLGSQRADVLTAFAIHAAAAVGNAEVHLRTEEYSEVLEGWVEHVSSVLQVTDAISTSLDLDEALQALSRATASVMKADECVIFLPDRDGKLAVRSCFCNDERTAELLQVRLSPGESATGIAFAEKKYVACSDASSCDDPLIRKLCKKSGLRGILCAPLVVGDEAIGVITLYCFEPREFSQREIQLLMSIGLHAAIVIRNASLYTREASIAEALQKGLMPEAPDQCRGLRIAGRYIPALDEARVGGDFYDIIPLPSGKVAVAIADVSGKGLRAAIHLATCKYMLRALAYAYPDDPAAALGELNAAINYYFQQSFFVTAFYAVIDPADNTIRYASAGHPPAFLITERAEMHTCLSSTGTPVGSGQPCVYDSGCVKAKPGDVLLLYTDGVTDAMKDGMRLEIEGLHKMVFRLGRCSARKLVDKLFTQISDNCDPSRKDDIALLAISFEDTPAAQEAGKGGQSGKKRCLTAGAV